MTIRRKVIPLECREPEVRTPFAAIAVANFGFKSGAKIIRLLVSLRFRSSHQRSPRSLANFGIGTLAQMRPHTRAAAVLGRVAGDRLEGRGVLQGFQLDRIFSPPIRM